MLSNKQKNYLRAMGNLLEPIVFIGKGEVTSNVIKQLDEALLAHELVKVRVLKNCSVCMEDIITELTDCTNASEIQAIGKNILYYRPNPEKPRIELPK